MLNRLILFFVLTLSICSCKPDPVPQPPALTLEQREFLSNQDAYKRSTRASKAPTFEGAKVLLDGVKTEEITDPEIASYYALSRRFAEFCSEAGISRDSGTDWVSILKNVGLDDIVRVVKDPLRAARMLTEGFDLQKQIPIWNDLAFRLAKKYDQ